MGERRASAGAAAASSRPPSQDAGALFDVGTLPACVVVVGHYGAGKTNLALNLALDARRRGRTCTLADFDVVNPYFRSSDYAELLAQEGVRLIAPAMARSTLDAPSVGGEVVAAIEQARASGGAGLVVIDAGGDDAGAYALGRFAGAVDSGPYAMLYVVNERRSLVRTPRAACAVLREIEAASHLRATAIANNTHLGDETSAEVLSAGVAYAREVARAAGLPLAFTTLARGCDADVLGAQARYPVDELVRKPWE